MPGVVRMSAGLSGAIAALAWDSSRSCSAVLPKSHCPPTLTLMQITIHDVEADDLPAVLGLNDTAVPHVNRIDIEQMHWFAAHARYFRVAKKKADVVAFLIGLGPGLEYPSPNYRWFCDNYSRFIYDDRVVVGAAARQAGLASRLYEDFAATASGEAPVMTCEVNIRPANENSMQFHLHRGFLQVGSQSTEAGNKEVALMEKKL